MTSRQTERALNVEIILKCRGNIAQILISPLINLILVAQLHHWSLWQSKKSFTQAVIKISFDTINALDRFEMMCCVVFDISQLGNSFAIEINDKIKMFLTALGFDNVSAH